MAEVVRLKFLWNWVTPGKFKENNLANVNCLKLQIQEKPFRMFSLAYNLPKTMSDLCPSKLCKNDVHISTIKIRPIKVTGNNVDF